ncbi:MAG: ABC transporter permease [Christensenellales bacterium]
MNVMKITGSAKDSSIGKLYQRYGVLLILIVEVLIFSLASPNFFKLTNIVTIGRHLSFTGIATVGCAFLMITGGIDLSTGSMMAFSGILCTKLMTEFGVSATLAILFTVLLGGLIGCISGFSFTRLKIPALIATLSMQYILKGMAFLITNASPVYGLQKSFEFLGQGFLFDVFPVSMLVMIIAFVFGSWMLNSTYIGRQMYAVGENREAATLSGINTKRISMIAFAASGFFAAIAGILMAARLGSGIPSVGADVPMDVITPIVLGGVSIKGGSGKISNVFIGVIITGVLSRGMIMLGLSDYVQWVVKGIALWFAVAIGNVGTIKKRGGKREAFPSLVRKTDPPDDSDKRKSGL